MSLTLFRTCTLLLLAQLVHAAPCEPTGAPWLTLVVTASEVVAASDRTLTVRVDVLGCVAIHRPAFYREAGDFRWSLAPAELAALRAQFDVDKLQRFDAAQVRAQLASTQSARGSDRIEPRAERFLVVDADRFQLQLSDGTKSASVEWQGLHAYAEFYPELKALTDLSAMVQAAQALSARADATRVVGGAP